MKTQKEILAEIIDLDKELIDFYWHSSDFITPYQACKAMQEYAEEYHRNEINKLNKSDVKCRFLLVYDKLDEHFDVMETDWTNKELYLRWDVISEYKTKDEAKAACDIKNGI